MRNIIISKLEKSLVKVRFAITLLTRYQIDVAQTEFRLMPTESIGKTVFTQTKSLIIISKIWLNLTKTIYNHIG